MAPAFKIRLPSGRMIDLKLRVSKRARNILLHVSHFPPEVELVLPRGVSRREGLHFAASKAAWISSHLRSTLTPLPFTDGASFPFQGEMLTIRHLPWVAAGAAGAGGSSVWRHQNLLNVPGPDEHVPVQVTAWLRSQADREIRWRTQAKAARLGRTVRAIAIRDTKSRWGSCSPDGRLSFSWRLVLAPETVLDYVVAHEVAHLQELNHSRRFWDLVDTLTEHTAQARNWLREEGPHLYRYGEMAPLPEDFVIA